MNVFDDPGVDSAEDSAWLSDETNLMADKLSKRMASATSQLPTLGTSPSGSDDKVHGEAAEATEPRPKTGGKVKIRYNDQEYSFVLGRNNPSELPTSVFEVIKTMKIGEKRQVALNSTTEPSSSLLKSTLYEPNMQEDSYHRAHEPKVTNDQEEGKKCELELLQFEDVIHVVEGGHIVKRRIFCPKETENDKHTPVFETVVTVDLEGRIEETGEVFDVRTGESFRVGEGDVGLGLERAVRTMHKGEKAEFTFMPPWHTDLCENPRIEIPDWNATPVIYKITLHSFEDAKTPWELTTFEDHLEQAILRKDSGNKAHEAKKYSLAITKYTKAQLFLEVFKDFQSPEQTQQFDDLKVLLWLNLAASNLKVEQYDKVKLHCTSALELDPKNVKGLYRRASACVALREFDMAHKDLLLLLEIEPTNSLAKHLLGRVESQLKAYEREQRETYQRIFSPTNPPPQEEPLSSISKTKKATGNSSRIIYGIMGFCIVVAIAFLLKRM